MKHLLLLFLISCTYFFASSQNVGIDILNPSRAKFEVSGVGAAGTTSAIFGTDGAGIALIRTTPAIGFNQYSSNVYKYLANGFSASQKLDMTTGNMYFDLFPSGTGNNIIPAGKRALTLYNNGNVGVNGSTINAAFSVLRGTAFDGTAVFAGTTNWTHFNYGTTEDTYIRAGKDGSDVYVNDILNGNVFLGNGTSKVGINTTAANPPIASLEVNGGVACSPAFAYVSTTSNVVTIGDRSYVYVTNSQAGTVVTFTITNGISPGQIVMIESDEVNAFAGIDLLQTATVNLESTAIRLKGGDVMTLLWNGSKWHETALSHNY